MEENMYIVFRDKSVKAAEVSKALKESGIPAKSVVDSSRGEVKVVADEENHEDIREAIEDTLHVEILEINEVPEREQVR